MVATLKHALFLAQAADILSAAAASAEVAPLFQSEAQLGPGPYYEFSACQGFRAESSSGSGWLLEDCINVWRSWARSLDESTAFAVDDRRFFIDVAGRLRRQKTPCYVQPPSMADGAGSRSMRIIATWVLARELGCDCLFPNYHQPEGVDDGNLYCHPSTTAKRGGMIRCSSISWIEYFNMSNQMTVAPNDNATLNAIDVRRISALQESTVQFLSRGGFDRPPWVHWILRLGNAISSQYFTVLETWDAAKLQAVAEVLRQTKENYRQRQQPRYVDDGDCHFLPGRLNIAIHVRLGDREDLQSPKRSNARAAREEYFRKLESFMYAVTTSAQRQRQPSPAFHIFSETSSPCPSKHTATFEEFHQWRVKTEQIDACMEASTPAECSEKHQGASGCNPDRSGVFQVQGRPLHLHVGLDVASAMTCMIEADGLLLGCSTFGHIAGVHSEGIKFFSLACEGPQTGNHYKMTPPMAISEQGNMWVPVTGSWRNPVIYSERILDAGLAQVYERKRLARDGPGN